MPVSRARRRPRRGRRRWRRSGTAPTRRPLLRCSRSGNGARSWRSGRSAQRRSSRTCWSSTNSLCAGPRGGRHGASALLPQRQEGGGGQTCRPVGRGVVSGCAAKPVGAQPLQPHRATVAPSKPAQGGGRGGPRKTRMRRAATARGRREKRGSASLAEAGSGAGKRSTRSGVRASGFTHPIPSSHVAPYPRPPSKAAGWILGLVSPDPLRPRRLAQRTGRARRQRRDPPRCRDSDATCSPAWSGSARRAWMWRSVTLRRPRGAGPHRAAAAPSRPVGAGSRAAAGSSSCPLPTWASRPLCWAPMQGSPTR